MSEDLDKVIQREIDQIILDLQEARKHVPRAGHGWDRQLTRWLRSAQYKIKALESKIPNIKRE